MNRNERTTIILGTLGLIVAVCGCIAAWLVVPPIQHLFSTPERSTPIPSSFVQEPTSEVIAPSLTVAPITPNVIEPTNTLLPTFTPIPQPTIEPTITATREYYDQGEFVNLGGNTYISLRSTFGRSGENCGAPSGGFSVMLNLKNTAQEQFLLRFDAQAFQLPMIQV